MAPGSMTGKDGSRERLEALGIDLPDLAAPVNAYVDAVMDDGLLYLSGKGPRRADGSRTVGKVGGDVSIEQACEDARITGINLLAAIRAATGSLEKVDRVIKVLALVNAVPEFADHPKVIDSFSSLMVDVFGEKGRHARSAFGVGGLPNGMTIEIEMIVRVSV